MAYNPSDIPKDGNITIRSIFEFKDGFIEIQELLHAASRKNCVVYFENEDWQIKPNDMNDIATRAKLNAYSSIITYPKAVIDYCNYLFSLADRK